VLRVDAADAISEREHCHVRRLVAERWAGLGMLIWVEVAETRKEGRACLSAGYRSWQRYSDSSVAWGSRGRRLRGS
jgi:hypothetical protein